MSSLRYTLCFTIAITLQNPVSSIGYNMHSVAYDMLLRYYPPSEGQSSELVFSGCLYFIVFCQTELMVYLLYCLYFIISMDSLMFGLTCLSHHLYIYYYPRNLLM